MRRLAPLLLLALAACDPIAAENEAPGRIFADWYPDDTSPPRGTAYPCAFSPLPKSLEGIPPSHHEYVNHAAGLLVKCIHQRLIVHKGLAEGSEPVLATYLEVMRTTRDLLARETPPASLRGFHDDLVAAIDLQVKSYPEAFAARQQGKEVADALRAAPGFGQASARLHAAWTKLEQRYPGWSPAVKDSLYHHLCALDIY